MAGDDRPGETSTAATLIRRGVPAPVDRVRQDKVFIHAADKVARKMMEVFRSVAAG